MGLRFIRLFIYSVVSFILEKTQKFISLQSTIIIA